MSHVDVSRYDSINNTTLATPLPKSGPVALSAAVTLAQRRADADADGCMGV